METQPESVSDELIQEGRWDSSGAFSLSPEAAFEKLGASQLPRASAWLLKILQWAVSSGAERLEIRQSSRQTRILVRRCGVEVEALLAALGRVNLESDPIGHLAVALRSVGVGDGRPFRLSCKADTLSWDGQTLTRAAAANHQTGDDAWLEVDFPKDDRGRRLLGLARGAGRAADEYLELVQHAEAAPIPVSFDGLRLDRLSAYPKAAREHTVTTVLSLGWPSGTCFSQAETPELSVPPGLLPGRKEWEVASRPQEGDLLSRFLQRFQTRQQAFVDGDASLGRVPLIVKLLYHTRTLGPASSRALKVLALEPSFCHWIRDGAICCSEKLDLPEQPLSLALYLSAQDLASDASGLTVVPCERSRQRLQQALPAVLELVRNTRRAARSVDGPTSEGAMWAAGWGRCR